ncbi:MAG: MFS transporter, partial [Firmicutes bacterium]|nr:MFS transporter [Bacillota bacterium]
MDPERRKALNIEIHYAIAQFLYWAAACCLQGFTAVFLSSRGMSDGMVGIAVSMTSVAAIFLQLFVSNFCDRHPEIPLKKITVAVSVISFVFVAVLHFTRPSIALIALLFMLADAPQKTNNGLLNAVMVQYVNAGIPVNYGWPRGIGSLGWAGGALIFGRLIAIYSPELLLSLFLGIEVLAIIAMLTMPSVAPVWRSKAGKGTTSYSEMLKSNKALALFLLSLIIMG